MDNARQKFQRAHNGDAAAQQAQPSTPGAPRPAPFDRLRYLRVVRFFAGVFLSVIWWDLILRRVPGVRGLAVRTSAERWRQITRRFRRLAIQLGGVLIKLGQFLSIRVDVLPSEVTGELAGLQDEVPAESLADVQAVIAAEFGRPVAQVFAWFAPVPEAAASLAQVHKARLPGGEEVVAKVQRPRIETQVETDLAAIRVAASWLKLYRPIARRVDLDRLVGEFAATTRAELDFIAEGKNAGHFADDFAEDPGIYLAQVYWEYTTRRVLTLENVASIKITDLAAIEAAGISREEVARRLYDTYLEQIFVNNFVHADPHPGNLFVRPLPQPPDTDPGAARPFELIFVDFGMVATIPKPLRASLREYVIGLGTRDSHRIVQAYSDAGVLLPGADRKRLEEIHDVLFQGLEGMTMGQLSDIARVQAELIMREYRDIVFEMPFQFPTEILFVARAVGILSGMATTLDPEFDPWSATIPFAEQLAADELGGNWRTWLAEVGELGRIVVRLPTRVDRLMTQAERGELTLQTSLAPDATKALRRVERSVDRLTWVVITVGLLIAGVVLRAAEGPGGLSSGLLVSAALAFLWGLTRR
ncbi:MAG: ABC transporter [Chloroflexi bacterium HGW-Chloroflexi-1]|nr:MAG: ABC transporter [Chloroflexi bacterium HGW-Chloroflexi-1]